MPINLSGILLPVTTPFTETQEFDALGLKKNLEKWNETGVAGYVVLGSTGERVHLDEREYLRVIDTARQAVPGLLSFIAGAGQHSTRGTIKEIRQAARAGAEAALVITPYFYRRAISQDALVTYYAAIADAAAVPIILYSIPDLTGIKIEPETAARLSEHENIIGIKDSSADLAGVRETLGLAPPDFSILIGNGTLLRDALAAGARGGILAVGCVVPQLCVEIFRAVRLGETARSDVLQEKLTPLTRAVTSVYGIGGLKAAMELAGFVGGAVRAPLQRPSEAAAQEIAELFHEAMGALACTQTPAIPSGATPASLAGSLLAQKTRDA